MPPITAGNNKGRGGEDDDTSTALFAPLLSSLEETSHRVLHLVETDVARHYADDNDGHDDEIDGDCDGEGGGGKKSKEKGFRASDGDGLDLLEAKNTLMLSYLADLAHLVHLRLSLASMPPSRRRGVDSGGDDGGEGDDGSLDGTDDDDDDEDDAEAGRRARTAESIEACVARLDEVRVALDRVRPLERKLSHQIDRLLSMATSTATAMTAPRPSGAGGGRRGLLHVADGAGDESSSSSGDEDGNGAFEEEEEEEEGEGRRRGLDALSFRPNPHALVGKDDEDEEEGGDESGGGGCVGDAPSSSSEEEGDDDDDEDLRAAREAARSSESRRPPRRRGDDHGDDHREDGRRATIGGGGNSPDAAGLYRAPRLASVHYLDRKEREERTAERQARRDVERMRKSELLQTLRAAHGTAPEEEDADGGAMFGKTKRAARSMLERDTERERFEEGAFVRLTVSRKDKRERNRIMQEEKSNLRAISDLGNLASDVAVFEQGGRRTGMGGSGGGGGGVGREGYDDADDLLGGKRHSNGKRKRGGSSMDEGVRVGARDGAGKKKESRRAAPKNSLQSALYGMDGGGGRKQKGRRKKSN